jgi:hypothetical protein
MNSYTTTRTVLVGSCRPPESFVGLERRLGAWCRRNQTVPRIV